MCVDRRENKDRKIRPTTGYVNFQAKLISGYANVSKTKLSANVGTFEK